MTSKIILLRIWFSFLLTNLFVVAQAQTTLAGTVKNAEGQPLEGAYISIAPQKGDTTDKKGNFLIKNIPAGKIRVTVSHFSSATKSVVLDIKPNVNNQINFNLTPTTLDPVKMTAERTEDATMVDINPQNAQFISSPGGRFIALIKSEIGVSSSSELSTGYSVRGGNFDENLIYVNGVQIYRPFLARTGQQAGLSFVNPDMVEDIKFSAGGFAAKYGDKMSSVLDVTYKRPVKFAASVSGSFLGMTAHIEDAIVDNKLKYVMGLRYKSNNYVLSGLDTKGDYKPNFLDYQAFITYDFSPEFSISLMGVYSDNNYRIIPQTRESVFGHVQDVKKLTIFYEGQESTRFRVGTGAAIFTFKPTTKQKHKLIVSYYNTKETERLDILGEYYLSQVEADLGAKDFGQESLRLGVGGFLNHARNRLEAQVFSAKLTSEINNVLFGKKTRTIQHSWGIKYSHEIINDKLNQWNILDSSGYLIPFYGYADTAPIELNDVLKTKIALRSHRVQAYYQIETNWLVNNNLITLNTGLRGHYWTYNNDILVSPRMQLSWKPNTKADLLFRAAGGVYFQAPFYRELRDLEGNLQPDIKAQRSIHAILGVNYNFQIWGRPFTFITEVYYKNLQNINPYEIRDVRIRYYANNNAHGYAAGIDMKLNGEFIPGLQSWATLSVMRTEIDIENDEFIDANTPGEPGFIPRPTDKRFRFSLFFQDHIPKVPRLRVHLSLHFGTGLTFGPPRDGIKYTDTLRTPFYRRVDIGFSGIILPADRKIKNENSFWNHFASIWASFEVFNLFNINNTVSYLWIRDIAGTQYAVPNYLTPRLFNLRVVIKFR